ncbi:MAG: hypothetical protein Q7K54_05385 [Candidatus Parcubacteria bacterium]|nr:hypothetical protein [Candidatus Parcubacteria bacterium]
MKKTLPVRRGNSNLGRIPPDGKIHVQEGETSHNRPFWQGTGTVRKVSEGCHTRRFGKIPPIDIPAQGILVQVYAGSAYLPAEYVTLEKLPEKCRLQMGDHGTWILTDASTVETA